jgi:branched-chain amino acid aminotransferase group I
MSKYNLPDPRNEDTFLYVNGLVKRNEAAVSPLDSAVQGGDAVWEGLRLYKGKLFQLEEHLNRLFDSAHILCFENIPSRDSVKAAIKETLEANKMHDGVHIRLTLSRGVKTTSGMNPKLNTLGCTLIIVPEYKGFVYGEDGLNLVTSNIRRNPPFTLDSKIHHANLLNNILAKIDGNRAGADDAIMLDVNGFIAETNATNIFIVKNGKLLTPFGEACLPGFTRAKVIELAHENNIPCAEKNISLAELYTADEAFTTGTMGALSWIKEADGRIIGKAEKGNVTSRLQELYAEAVALEAVEL